MPKTTAADLAMDHVHCRAICDEIGERLRCQYNREVSDIPPNLLRLLGKLHELDGISIVLAPSIVPSDDPIPLGEVRNERTEEFSSH